MTGLPSRYEWFLARKLLLRSHRLRFIPLVGGLSVAGVALGVASLGVVLSVMSGFEADLQNKITAMSAHVWIQPLADPDAAGAAGALRRIGAVPGVAAAGTYQTTQVLLETRDAAQGAVVFGLDGAAAGSVVQLAQHLRLGKLPDFGGNEKAIVLGHELAEMLGVLPGDPLVLVTARGRNLSAPMLLRVRVAATIEVGMYDYDAHTAYVPLACLRALAGSGEGRGWLVRTTDVLRAHATAVDLQVALGHGYLIRDWLVVNRNLFFAIRTEKIVMFLILLIIVTVAAFNITSSLIMTVMEKTRAIGVLNALGVPPRRLASIFVWQGVLVGGAGVAAGTGIGALLCAIIAVYPIRMPGGGSVYYLTTLPVQVNWAVNLLLIPAVALVLCVLAAAYPAWQASRLDPVEAIRYE